MKFKLNEEIKFEKVGSYWNFPLHKKIYLNIIYWFRGLWLFLGCLLNYNESIKGNEFTLLDAYGLCFSIQEARMGKMLRMIFPEEKEDENIE